MMCVPNDSVSNSTRLVPWSWQRTVGARPKSRQALLFLLAIALLLSCEPAHQGEQVGIYRPSQRAVRILVCLTGEPIESVAVRYQGRPPGTPAPDRVIWKIVSTKGSRLAEFVPGDEPPGFHTVHELERLPLGRTLQFMVNDRWAQVVAIGDIPVGKLSWSTELVGPSEFRDRAGC